MQQLYKDTNINFKFICTFLYIFDLNKLANKNPKKETTQIVDFWGFFVYIVIIRRVLFPCRLYIGRSPF